MKTSIKLGYNMITSSTRAIYTMRFHSVFTIFIFTDHVQVIVFLSHIFTCFIVCIGLCSWRYIDKISHHLHFHLYFSKSRLSKRNCLPPPPLYHLASICSLYLIVSSDISVAVLSNLSLLSALFLLIKLVQGAFGLMSSMFGLLQWAFVLWILGHTIHN